MKRSAAGSGSVGDNPLRLEQTQLQLERRYGLISRIVWLVVAP